MPRPVSRSSGNRRSIFDKLPAQPSFPKSAGLRQEEEQLACDNVAAPHASIFETVKIVETV